MNEASIVIKASGHIRFGLGGPPAQELTQGNSEFLPVFTVPIQSNVTYYRKIYLINTDTSPYYKWKLKAVSEDVAVKMAYHKDDNKNFTIINASKVPPLKGIEWKEEITYKDTGLALLEPQQEIGIWLQIQPKAKLAQQRFYEVILIFEGYS